MPSREELAEKVCHALDYYGCVDWNMCFSECADSANEDLIRLLREHFEFDCKDMVFRVKSDRVNVDMPRENFKVVSVDDGDGEI